MSQRAAAPWLSRDVVAWSLYDVASSAFSAVVLTYFGLYFVSIVLGDAPGSQALWGVLAASSMIVAGILAPVVGAWADRRGGALGVIAAFTLLFVAAGFAMRTGGPGMVAWMAVVFLAAQVGYTLAVATYDSLLVRLVDRGRLGRVSGFGWSIGFIGGMLAIAASIALMRTVPPAGQTSLLPGAFLIAATVCAVLAWPALHFMRRPPGVSDEGSAGTPAAVQSSFRRVLHTLRHWRRDRQVFRFLLGFFLINDALVTLVFFIVIVARDRFGLSIEGMLWLSLMFHAIAMPMTFVFGHAADRFGHKPVMLLQVGILAAGMLLLGFGKGVSALVASIALLGLVYGSLQSVCRSWLALLLDSRRAGEIYGFNAVAGRLSAAVGPLVFGLVVAGTGSQGIAIGALLGFLAAGVLVLRGVEDRAGAQAAARPHGRPERSRG